jgi:hypothetical protein
MAELPEVAECIVFLSMDVVARIEHLVVQEAVGEFFLVGLFEFFECAETHKARVFYETLVHISPCNKGSIKLWSLPDVSFLIEEIFFSFANISLAEFFAGPSVDASGIVWWQ